MSRHLLRTALLGCGSFAHRHARTLRQLNDEVEMVAFCNRTIEKAVEFSRQYTNGQASVFADHHKMFEEVQMDAVIICLPPYAHSDEVDLAASRGINVFIEKPIALTSEKGWQMVEAAEKFAIVTQVGFMFRFGEAVERLKMMIDSGEAGPVGLMSARYFCNALHAPWWRQRSLSGGQLVEQVIHMVDLMRFLMGDATTIYSRQENLFHQEVADYTVEDVSATVLGFPQGGVGVIYATNGAIPGRWINDYRLVSKNLTADFSNANNATFHFTAHPDRTPEIISSDRDFYLLEMQDFLTAIRTGQKTRTPLREGAKSLDLALAATRSAQLGSEVHLSANDQS
ncbi:MAG TPA: Gfo/Idh/MocA family oxidoreductase [Anaerolineales bacterium]|nr:Gfo/Idh/MocA family oxidoreductase [Anaerolineales bacterium]